MSACDFWKSISGHSLIDRTNIAEFPRPERPELTKPRAERSAALGIAMATPGALKGRSKRKQAGCWMNDKEERLRRTKIRGELKELEKLVYEWSPFGIPDLPEDEFSCLVPGIYKQLRQGVSVEEFIEHLDRDIEDLFGGITITEQGHAHNRHYAEKFLDWWKSQQR